LPRPITAAIALAGTEAYRFANARREEIVFNNLLPIFSGDEKQARKATRRLFRKFAAKMTDLFRYEAGVSMLDSFHDFDKEANLPRITGKNGTLLVTPHLGNWEIGGALLAAYNVRFVAVTQAEPSSAFTGARMQARAQRGIETVVVGQDAFSFLELIRKLQSGATVAMLIDRPGPASSVQVELFGRNFSASSAPAELARISGCAVVPTYVTEEEGRYKVGILEPFEIDRRALGDREGRHEFTRQMMARFEPVIRQYADQWYQFVPIWPS
jgi:lauroyl/myristoyl acyltransferase